MVKNGHHTVPYGGLYDQVPLERMSEAECAVRAAVKRLPEEIFRPIWSGQDLRHEDHDVLLKTAKEALTGLTYTALTEAKQSK